MAEPLVVIGAGGFGREVLDVVDAINAHAEQDVWQVLGVVDDAPSAVNLDRLESRGAAYLGTIDEFLGQSDGSAIFFVVGVGSPTARQSIVRKIDGVGLPAATLVHPAATVGSSVTLGAGTVVCAGARLTTNIVMGRHGHVNPNVTIGHDTVLQDFVSLNPASSVSGDCLVQEGVLVGVGAVILNQLRVGAYAIVGAGACVVRNVADRATVKGVPAR